MKNIAIVEDENEAYFSLLSFIEKYGKETNQEFKVSRFSNGEEFLNNYQSIYAVIFMDIQMPKKNGMDTAIELRKIDKTVSLIFVTNLVQYAQNGYEVDAISFIVKPIEYYDFTLKFQKAIDIYLMNEERTFALNVSGGICCISSDKLMYVEILNHRLYYHLIDDIIQVTGVLSQAEKELSEFGFLRCNNCYLVNPKFITKVQGNLLYIGPTILQISRSKKAQFMEGLTNWFSGGNNK